VRRYTRHEEVPVYEHRRTRIEANCFNRVALVLKRDGGELRLALPTLHHLDLILQADAWIVVDRALNDVPLFAWTAFQVDPEHRLHHPVPCLLRLFHAQGGLLRRRVLDDLERQLDERLGAHGDARVLPFRGGGG
jgi:hypothetical protein